MTNQIRITEPGVYDIPADAYHADAAPLPSLSAGGIKVLRAECPRIFWEQNRRLNPAARPVASDTFDIGTAAHLVYLEPGAIAGAVVEVDAADWRTKAAREAKAEARAAGKVPLLPKDAELLSDMRAEFFANPVAVGAFRGGRAEQSMFWRDRAAGVWCRARPDYMPDNHAYVVDYKTSTTANPRDLSRIAYDQGWHQRAAWYLDGVAAVTGVAPEEYWFVVQSKKPPHLVSVVKLDTFAIDAGRQECRAALDAFARCLAGGTDKKHWPGYRRPDAQGRDAAFVIGLPAWAYMQIQDRYDNERPSAAVLARRATEAQAPLEY